MLICFTVSRARTKSKSGVCLVPILIRVACIIGSSGSAGLNSGFLFFIALSFELVTGWRGRKTPTGRDVLPWEESSAVKLLVLSVN